jgi:hypothetical protein
MKDESLAGQNATIKTPDGEEVAVVFGPNVHLKWASGRNLSSNEPPALHPEITGHLASAGDYSKVKDAELILEDKRVFRISFIDSSYFLAYESINSRTHVD